MYHENKELNYLIGESKLAVKNAAAPTPSQKDLVEMLMKRADIFIGNDRTGEFQNETFEVLNDLAHAEMLIERYLSADEGREYQERIEAGYYYVDAEFLN